VLVSDVDDEELPVHLALVDHRVAAEHFGLQHGSCRVQLAADLAGVHGVVVACSRSVNTASIIARAMQH
jgi:hypothetical protein